MVREVEAEDAALIVCQEPSCSGGQGARQASSTSCCRQCCAALLLGARDVGCGAARQRCCGVRLGSSALTQLLQNLAPQAAGDARPHRQAPLKLAVNVQGAASDDGAPGKGVHWRWRDARAALHRRR